MIITQIVNVLDKNKMSVTFPDLASVFQGELVRLHDYIYMYLLGVIVFIVLLTIFVTDGIDITRLKKNNMIKYQIKDVIFKTNWIFKKEIINYITNMLILDNNEFISLEAIFSSSPGVMLSSFIMPTVAAEYTNDPSLTPIVIVKIIGWQWAWNYELVVHLMNVNTEEIVRALELDEIEPSEILSKKYEVKLYDYNTYKKNITSNIDHMSKINEKGIRLLSVNENLVLPVGVPIRLLITSGDVLHSWSVPSLGVKIDAVPGRLSNVMIIIDRPGMIYGQCSEMCGPLHSFMPIAIEAVSMESFVNYLCLEGEKKERPLIIKNVKK